MTKFLPFLFLFFTAFSLSAQDEIIDLVNEGIKLHDDKQHQAAIEVYKKALKLDKKSSLVNYEIGFSYHEMGDYDKAIKYLDVVIKNDADFAINAYLVKGAAQELMGKVNDAVKTFNKAIKKSPEAYSPYYSLALTLYRNERENEAEKYLLKTIELNPSHVTSNYLLGAYKASQGDKVQSILALYMFLFMEPNTNRSKEALKLLNQQLLLGATKTGDNDITINIDNATLENNEFADIDLFLSVLSATNIGEKGDKTEEVKFAESTESLFQILKESREGKKGFYWDTYVSIFVDILDAGHVEAFAYFVSLSKGGAVMEWLEQNEDKIDAFGTWAQGQ